MSLNHRPHRVVLLVLGLACLCAAASTVSAQDTDSGSPDSVENLDLRPVELAPAEYGAMDDGLDELRHAYRSTTAAVVMSVPFPGWGQFYGEAPFWGVVSFGVQMWFYGNIVLEMARSQRQEVAGELAEPGSSEQEYRDSLATENKERAKDYVWWAAGSLLLVSLDAYVSVQLVDFDSPDPPTPDLDRNPGATGGNGGGLALTLQLPF